jgi:hypothetical protein
MTSMCQWFRPVRRLGGASGVNLSSLKLPLWHLTSEESVRSEREGAALAVVLAAGLMLTSAVAAAWSTYLYWLPCRGSMLEGTLIQPSSGDGRTYEEFERLDPAVKAAMRACEARMDGDISGQALWTSEMFVLAMALAGLAWLTLVVGLRWQLRTKAVAALPGLATVGMALAVAVTIGDAERGEDNLY